MANNSFIRCRDCEKSIGWDEATDENYTNISFDFDGLCYKCKRNLIPLFKGQIRERALQIIKSYKK